MERWQRRRLARPTGGSSEAARAWLLLAGAPAASQAGRGGAGRAMRVQARRSTAVACIMMGGAFALHSTGSGSRAGCTAVLCVPRTACGPRQPQHRQAPTRLCQASACSPRRRSIRAAAATPSKHPRPSFLAPSHARQHNIRCHRDKHQQCSLARQLGSTVRLAAPKHTRPLSQTAHTSRDSHNLSTTLTHNRRHAPKTSAGAQMRAQLRRAVMRMVSCTRLHVATSVKNGALLAHEQLRRHHHSSPPGQAPAARRRACRHTRELSAADHAHMRACCLHRRRRVRSRGRGGGRGAPWPHNRR
jgi:hypothetical protein